MLGPHQYAPLNNEDQPLKAHLPQHHGKPSFTIFRRIPVSFRLALAIFCVGCIIGQSTQTISLPLFLSTLLAGDVPGMPAYFVIWFCSFCFAIIFGSGAIFLVLKGNVTPEMRAWKWHKYLALIGFFDAANGILIVYSAFLSRVPGPVGAILSNSTILYTIFFSKIILHKKYNMKQLFGVLLVLIGILITLIPTFVVIHKGQTGKAANWYWPLVALIGYLPSALMNIIQEKMQEKFNAEAKVDKRFSVIYLQAIESTYQWLSMCFLFWTDLIPGFGVSGGISIWWNTFVFDWKCFLGFSSAELICERCHWSSAIGIIFISGYLLTYIFGTEMTMYASANLNAVTATIPPVIGVMFWYVFPKVNEWGGGAPLHTSDLAFNLGAIPAIVAGMLIYRMNEVEDKQPDAFELADGGVELCC